MGIKARNLEKLLKNNINIFEYKELSTKEQIEEYLKENEQFTIRFDRSKDIQNLPFYKYSKELDIDKICKEAEINKCTMIVSNGYKYDKYLLFNFVIEIKNNNFVIELCDKKIPLREMYNEKTTIIKGNVFNDYKDYEFFNKTDNKYSKENIYSIINFVLENNMKYKYIEGTIYSKNVGILKSNIIVWQTN